MNPWIDKQLSLLRGAFPELEYLAVEHWCRIPEFGVPPGWSTEVVELCFRLTESEAIAPYAFWVRPALTLSGGATPTNYTAAVETCFGDGWGQFSWSPVTWRPLTDADGGDNILHFVRSFTDRLRELS
jgi:hypothetical protein